MVSISSHDQHQIRCKKCNKLLAMNGYHNNVEIKCARCGYLNIIFEEMSSEQVVITDSDGVILFANGAFSSITGYSVEEVLGKTPSLWGGQMSREFYQEMWHAIKHEKKSIQVVVKNKKKDGTLYDAKLRISPILDTEGEIRFFIAIETVV